MTGRKATLRTLRYKLFTISCSSDGKGKGTYPITSQASPYTTLTRAHKTDKFCNKKAHKRQSQHSFRPMSRRWEETPACLPASHPPCHRGLHEAMRDALFNDKKLSFRSSGALARAKRRTAGVECWDWGVFDHERWSHVHVFFDEFSSCASQTVCCGGAIMWARQDERGEA